MKSKIIIVGPGAAGKDTLKQRFIEKGFRPSISCTTRPPRENEVDGKDYHFISLKEFKERIEKGLFYEWQVYGQEQGLDWHYGTLQEEFEKAQVFIMTPAGIADLKPEHRAKCMIIYLNPPKQLRELRLSERNDADKVQDRLLRDDRDFKDFTDFDVEINNSEF